MAHMSPDMYRGVLEKANGLINKAKAYLNGRTTDGLIMPIIFKDELEKMILECENTKANLSVAIKGLKQHSPKESGYQNALDEINNAQRDLQYHKDKLFR